MLHIIKRRTMYKVKKRHKFFPKYGACVTLHQFFQENLKFVFTLFFTVPPTFSSQLPTSKTTKTENETVSYSCTVEAKPAATIQWILNGQNLTLGTPPYNISVSVAPIVNSKLLRTLAYLTVNRVTWRQNGSFSCLAFNDAGKKSQTTELEVRCKCRSRPS